MATSGAGSRPLRARFREQVRDDVKSAALEQLATGGAGAISLNAIAKRLGVTGPALYRYFGGRDDLLTALVVDAYHDLRDALAGVGGGPGPAPRMRAVVDAYRRWAQQHPHRYELLFRPPLPGYEAHAGPVSEAAGTLMVPVLAALGADPDDPAAVAFVMRVWARLHGFVGLEIGGAWAAVGVDADAFFADEMDAALSGSPAPDEAAPAPGS